MGRWLLESVGITALIAWLCYNSLWGVVLFPVVAAAVRRLEKERREKLRRDRFLGEFKELMGSITASLSVGSSPENAFLRAQEDLAGLIEDDGYVMNAIRQINYRVSVSIPIEKAVEQTAVEIGYEEIINFASMFSFAKRLGGNYVKSIKRMTEKITVKIETEQEIEAMIAEKNLELKIMIAMPPAILAYLRLTSADYFNVMYHNAVGVFMMSICIAVYAALCVLGRKIVDIKV